MIKNIAIRLLILVSLFSSILWAIEAGELIENTATVSYVVHTVPKEIESNRVEHTLVESDAEIEFLYVSGKDTNSSVMGTTAYLDEHGIWHESQTLTLAGGMVIGNDTALSLEETGFYGVRDTAIIRVVDPSQNVDRAVRDYLEVTISVDNGDTERIRLVETGLNTGIFLGYMALLDRQGSNYDNYLYVEAGETIVANYGSKSVSLMSDSAVIVLKKDLKVWIEKRVNKEEVAVGELLQYELIVHNDEDFAVRGLTIDDALPLGLKYLEGTAMQGEDYLSPHLSEDAKDLLFDLEMIEAHASIKITFLATVTAGVHHHRIVNQAWVRTGEFFSSNIAKATTQIKEELIRSRGTIVGEVYDGSETNLSRRGVAGVRLYLEDGSYVVTDQRGRFHFSNISAGEHVIQVDKSLLPEGYEMEEKEQNSRLAGRSFSQFVHLGEGALKRVHFKLQRRANAQRNTPVASYEIPTKVAVMPEYGIEDLRAKEPRAILWPPKNYVPFIPSVEMAIRHPKSEHIEVWLNGYQVSRLNHDGTVSSKHQKLLIERYKGVDLLARSNQILVKFFDASNHLVTTLKRKVYVSSTPVQAIYLKENSQTIADGKNSPVIAVKFLDDAGEPLRSGMTGSFTIDTPYQTQASIDKIQQNPLAKVSNSNRYTIHSDGIAYIKLQPTTESGEVILHFDFNGRDEVIRAWLKPALREWIMVGFAEGGAGYNTLSGHQASLDEIAVEDKIITEGRISFFAKGAIKGEWLLSMAYDSGKDTKNSQLFDEIDPNQYYTLYGDSTQQNQEAASRKKLYVKLEKEQFNILYGDFSTDMSYTELASYSRRFTGLKSEYHGEYFEGKGFLSYTEQLFMRDEIRGDGTSGYYYIKSQHLIEFSEKIKIEVRHRYHEEEILATQELQRFKDYEIDYALGRLYFREPIYSNDEQFNPRYIIVEYEMAGDGESHYTYGGRVASKAMKDQLEVGGSYIHEDSGKKSANLMGVDMRMQVTPSTEIKAEYATSETTQEGTRINGDAKLAEIEHMDDGVYLRAYYREQERRFGLGQLNEGLGGTRKIGAELSKEFENRQKLQSTLSQERDLISGDTQDVFESRVEMDSAIWNLYGGYRYSKESYEEMVQQFLLGASYRFFDQRLKVSVTHDQTLSQAESQHFPTKSTVGIDYAISSSLNLFSNYEWSSDQEQGRIGLRLQPWAGMSIENTTLTQKHNDAMNLYNTLGALQSYQLTKRVGINVGYERGEALDANESQDDKDFDAFRLGLSYNAEQFSANLSGEYRESVAEEKINLSASLSTQKSDNLAMALSANLNEVDGENSEQSNKNLRFSLVYRAQDEMMILEKLDFVSTEKRDENQLFKTEKLIHNMNLNLNLTEEGELSLQHGMKYVVDTVDHFEYRGLTQLFGLDASYDITKRWELGVQGSLLYAQSAHNMDYGLGIYSGHNLLENMLFTLGYNWLGFEDSDFSLQNYRVEGAFFRFNMKFDQGSLKETARMMSW